MASDPKTLSNVPGGSATAILSTDRLRRLTARTWRVLEYSSVYLSLIAAAKVLIVMYVLSLPMNLAPLVGALITFAVYTNDRLIDIDSDSVSNPGRTAFIEQNQRTLYVVAAVAYGLGVAVAAVGGAVAFSLAILPGVFWVVYAIDWIQVSTADVTRLKEVPVVNSLLVAVAWALPVVLVPIGFADATVTPAAGFLVLYFTFATFVSTEVSNVRDIESDRAAGVSTLPTALGLSRTRVALYGLSACTLAILAVGVGWGALGVFQAGVLSLGVASLVMVVSLFGRISNERLLALGAECTPVPVLGVLAVVPVV